MNEIIRKRKSIRKFDKAVLDDESLENVKLQITKLIPLFPDIKYSVEIVSKTKGIFGIKAPHYLAFYGEINKDIYVNIGYIGQQMDLFFSECGLGSCWLGVAKPDEKEFNNMPCIITMAFGKPAQSLYRDVSEFKRKLLSDISEGLDNRLEAARLAPSGMNKQNWYFIVDNGKIHCYRKKSLLGFMDNMTCIDIGIAIYHIAVETDGFTFSIDTTPPVRDGYIYVGTAG